MNTQKEQQCAGGSELKFYLAPYVGDRFEKIEPVIERYTISISFPDSERAASDSGCIWEVPRVFGSISNEPDATGAVVFFIANFLNNECETIKTADKKLIDRLLLAKITGEMFFMSKSFAGSPGI